MTIQIDSPEIENLAAELVAYTGETLPQAIANALRERLDREKSKDISSTTLSVELLRIGSECAALPVLDSRDPDTILGYTENGYPA